MKYELSGLLNSTINDSFYKTGHSKQLSLQQFQQNNDYCNVNQFDKLSKTIVVVQSKESLYNNFIDNIAKMESSITILSEKTPVQESCSTSIKGPLKQNINILSNESAFRKVEKSGKNKKRNRCKKFLKSKSEDVNFGHSESNGENSTKSFSYLPNEFSIGSDINEVLKKSASIKSSSIEKDQSLDEPPFIGVSRWINFKFDLNAILRSMEEVTQNKKKQL